MPQRYFLDEKSNIIVGQDAHHIKKVMRMKNGDEIVVCYDQTCFLASINVDNESVSFEIISEIKSKPRPHITLVQGLPKGSKTETIAKYATIFGASEIIFLEMQRSIPKVDNDSHKIKRLSLIAKEAAELAHRFDVPKISFEKHLKNIDFSTYDYVVLADENQLKTTLEEAIPKVNSNMKIALIIGPEGGISDGERTYFNSIQAVFVTLGELIFPTEVASLYALSYLSLKNS